MNKFLTPYKPASEIRAMYKNLIAIAKYTKKEIKVSSLKFANGKDKTGGYLARLILISQDIDSKTMKKIKRTKKIEQQEAQKTEQSASHSNKSSGYVIKESKINGCGLIKHFCYNKENDTYGIAISVSEGSPAIMAEKDLNEETATKLYKEY